ncbi:Germin-like protein 8-2 [Asimina triloba]
MLGATIKLLSAYFQTLSLAILKESPEIDSGKELKMAFYILSLALFTMVSSLVYASDPSPLQDFCVADPNSPIFVNGRVCKDPKQVQAMDFFFGGLNNPGNTANRVGSNVTQVNVAQVAGLNTLGISLVRIDFAPYGINAPHTHPRATEILTVLEGTLYVGFVTSNPDNRLITKVLNKGDVFVFPMNLIHFQFNVGKTKAVAIASLSSQNPGTVTIADAVFRSNPPISDDVLAKAFQVDKKIIDFIQAKF